MAAKQTVSQLSPFLNSTSQTPSWLKPQHGVVTLFGYGIKVHVDRGHLVLEDGIGTGRHRARLPRVGHGLRRLVVIGADGFVSLAALRWLADQDASFVMLERDGKVLAATGPVGPSDARLRRSQALARDTHLGVDIARELINQKLAAQEQIARDRLNSPKVADAIAASRMNLSAADNVEAIRFLACFIREWATRFDFEGLVAAS
jgi:CRISPR/Cas system-associated endonuclease Cas1